MPLQGHSPHRKRDVRDDGQARQVVESSARPPFAGKLCEIVSIVMLRGLKTRPMGCVNAAKRRSSTIFGQYGGASIPP